jgi:uncharacterized protein YdaU (DUF1376 family)
VLFRSERRQCGLVNARSGGEIESLRRVLAEYFIRMDDGLYNKRMSEEVAKAEHISADRRKGGLDKARRMRAAVRDAQAVLKQSKSTAPAGTPTPTPTPTLTTTTTKEKSRGARFTLAALPDGWKDFCKSTRPDLNAEVTFDAFRDYWTAVPGAKGTKLDWSATWRNWVRGQRAPSAAVPQVKPWHETASGTKAMGAKLGLLPEDFCFEDGRQDWQGFAAAVKRKAGVHA